MAKKPSYKELERRVRELEKKTEAYKKAKEALRESERRVRILLDFVPYPIVVFTLDGRVYYLNPAFTETFGWSLDELRGKTIPYTPPGLQEETGEMIRKLMEEKVVLRHETKRLTKDGRMLDVVMRAVIYSQAEDEPAGELVILRDITQEKRAARNNEAILRISTALPEYPDLEDLLDFVSREVKQLLDTEGALVILKDEERGDLFFLGAAYDDTAAQQKVKKIRLPADKSIAGKVIRTGEPVIVPDTSKEPDFYPGVDRALRFHTRNLLDVPLRSKDRVIGALCARNKKNGDFDQADVEMLSLIASTVSLSIENARFSDELKKAYRNNEAMLKISMALPKYPDLEDLLDYVSGEVKKLLDTEGALVILHDQETGDLFFLGVAYDDPTIRERVKEMRFPLDKLVAGQVIRSGEAMIVADAYGDTELYEERDKRLGYHTRNLLLVPLKSSDRIIGVLCGINKKKGGFDQQDVELLNMIGGTVALSIENARFSEELKTAYRELSSLERAKDKVINHLSHELKTPASVLSGALSILTKKLSALPEETWRPTIERAKRNLERIVDIQSKTEDIIREKRYKAHDLLSLILDQCTDELETLIAEEVGEGPVMIKVRKKIEEIFGAKETAPEDIALDKFVEERLHALEPAYSHRQVEVISRLHPASPIHIPRDALQKVIDGLIKNAIENTPDQGKIEVVVRKKGEGTELTVHDYGVGITEENQRRIFEGFFATQETLDYSTKRPFDFNAGGKGADLLRTKVFSERYGFKIRMESTRCRFIPTSKDTCPGSIGSCSYCATSQDCHSSGGTTFTLYFPPAGRLH